MNIQTEGTSPRDNILGILILGGLMGAAAGGIVYLASQQASHRNRPVPSIPEHAVLAPKPLKDIAAEAGMQPPTALAHLQRLEQEGKIQRIVTTEGPRYAVLPFVRCEWMDPDHGIRETWQSAQPVDWRFPLISRVPDERAQDFLLEWLDRAQARQLLPAFQSKFERKAKAPDLQVVVYGSCARGDAGPASDLDMVLYGDAPKKTMEALIDLAHEIALKTGRPPDIRAMDEAAWQSATPAFRQRLRQEAKTVFSTDYAIGFIERPLEVTHA